MCRFLGVTVLMLLASTGEAVAQTGEPLATRGEPLATRGDLIATRGDLIDRTLAIVGSQVITLSDVRAAIRLGLIAELPSAEPAAVTQQLVDRELMLREVQRYAPPAPADSAVEARVAEIRLRLPATNAWSLALEATGFTEVRLRAWVRDDLRTVAYLAQRFASASTPTESEIAAAVAQQRAEFERAVRSLGLRPDGVQTSRDVPADRMGGQAEGRRSKPPCDYREQFKAFMQGTCVE